MATPSPLRLFSHQEKAVEFSDRLRCGYFADCGVGKTVIGLTICSLRPMRTLVLAPLQVVYDAWLGDAGRFYRGLPVHVHHGPSRWKNRPSTTRPTIVLTTLETFRVDAQRLLSEFRPARVIVDESSKAKNRESKNFQAAVAATDAAKERYILTATPAAEGDDSAYWAQLRLLDHRTGGLADAPGATEGGPNFYRWAAYYCTPVRQMITNPRTRRRQEVTTAWRIRPERREEFERRLSAFVMRIDKADCLDLPDRIVQRINVELDREGAEAYASLLDGEMPESGDDVTALARKLHQVTGGVLSDLGDWREIGSAKIKAMISKAEEFQGAPFVVWIQYQAEARKVAAAMEKAGYRAGVCNGEAGPAKTRAAVAAFKAGELDVLVCHPQSVGHGITLTESGGRPCSRAIFYSLGYSYELHHQAMERIHRAGQRQACNYYLLVCADTIDETIVEALENKKDATDAVMNSLLARQKRQAGGIRVGGAP